MQKQLSKIHALWNMPDNTVAYYRCILILFGFPFFPIPYLPASLTAGSRCPGKVFLINFFSRSFNMRDGRPPLSIGLRPLLSIWPPAWSLYFRATLGFRTDRFMVSTDFFGIKMFSGRREKDFLRYLSFRRDIVTCMYFRKDRN